MAAGIETRHSRSCRARSGGRCNCEPTYRPWISQGGRKVRGPTSKSVAEATGWRVDATVAVRRGRGVQGVSMITLEESTRSWLEGARAGTIRTRSGDRYKPSSIRGYAQSLASHV